MKSKFAKRLGVLVGLGLITNDARPPCSEQKGDENTNLGQNPMQRESLKGQLLGGECSMTACDSRRANFWNIWTNSLYCRSCADGINYQEQVCVRVARRPTREEQVLLQNPSSFIATYPLLKSR